MSRGREPRHGAAGPTRRSLSGIARRVLVETTVGGLMGRGMLARPGARLGPRRCGRARVQVAGTRNGLASAPDADDRHGRHPPAQRKLPPPSPSHGAQGSRRAGVSEGRGVSQSGLVLSVSPVTAQPLSRRED